MNYLYLLVWECEEYASEAEWTHFVSDKEVIEYEEQIKIATDFMNDNNEEPEEFEIENIWLNAITMIDGHPITIGEKVEVTNASA